MKYLIILSFLFLPACAALQNTPKGLVASKCRLHVPMQRQDCEAAGIKSMWFTEGRNNGLPVSEMETGKTTVQLIAETENEPASLQMFK